MDVTISMDTKWYEVEIMYFNPEFPASYWEPGDAGEVGLGQIVRVTLESRFEDYVTYYTFITDYAIYLGLSLEKTEARVRDLAFKHVRDKYEDDAYYDSE